MGALIVVDCRKGDGVIIFTPDDTHFEIAKAAIEKEIHVLLTKPPGTHRCCHCRMRKILFNTTSTSIKKNCS